MMSSSTCDVIVYTSRITCPPITGDLNEVRGRHRVNLCRSTTITSGLPTCDARVSRNLSSRRRKGPVFASRMLKENGIWFFFRMRMRSCTSDRKCAGVGEGGTYVGSSPSIIFISLSFWILCSHKNISPVVFSRMVIFLDSHFHKKYRTIPLHLLFWKVL